MLSIRRGDCLGNRNQTAVQYYWYAYPYTSFVVGMGKVRLGRTPLTAFNIQSRFLLCTTWGGFNTLSQSYQGLLAFDNDGNSCQYGLSIGCHWTHAPTRH